VLTERRKMLEFVKQQHFPKVFTKPCKEGTKVLLLLSDGVSVKQMMHLAQSLF